MAKRQRWIYPNDGEPFEVGQDYVHAPSAPFVWGELPDYTSPVDGRLVSGRVARREDLRRNGCRPWEGMDQERKEASRRESYFQEKMDRAAHETASRAFYQLKPETRRILEGR